MQATGTPSLDNHSRQTAAESAPAVLALLREYHVSLAEIAAYTNLTRHTVQTALDPRNTDSCPLIVLAKVRAATEKHLVMRGWRGDRNTLWREFNVILAAAAMERTGRFG